MRKKKLKQTNVSAHLIQYRFKIREGRWAIEAAMVLTVLESR